MRRKAFFIIVSLAFILASSFAANAAELPPANSKPLSAIIKIIENKNTGTIAEAEFDDGYWEVEINKNNVCQELFINPQTGNEILRKDIHCDDDLPPAGSLPLSTIVRSVEAQKKGVIVEVEFDDGLWKFSLIQNSRKTKIYVTPQGNVKNTATSNL